MCETSQNDYVPPSLTISYDPDVQRTPLRAYSHRTPKRIHALVVLLGFKANSERRLGGTAVLLNALGGARHPLPVRPPCKRWHGSTLQ